jgi:hypothetical protein
MFVTASANRSCPELSLRFQVDEHVVRALTMIRRREGKRGKTGPNPRPLPLAKT